MESLTTERRIIVIQTYYENRRKIKNIFRKPRGFFDQHNRPSQPAIRKMVKRFEGTGSVTGRR